MVISSVKDTKLKAGGGKPKGGGYERETGAKLSLWLTDGKRDDLLCRTVGSGAQFTVAAQKNKLAGHAGDLMAQDPLAYELCNQYVIECKFWKNLQMIQFLDGRGELHKALQKVQLESLSVNKSWWLVAKQNHQKDFLIMAPKKIYSDFLINPAMRPRFHLLFNGAVMMYYLDEFLNLVKAREYLVI